MFVGKKKLRHSCFHENFAKYVRTLFFYRTFRAADIENLVVITFFSTIFYLEMTCPLLKYIGVSNMVIAIIKTYDL